MQVRLSESLSPVFSDYHTKLGVYSVLSGEKGNAKEYVYNMTEGGRGSFKTSTNAVELALLMLIPKTDIVVLRENYKDHRDSTYIELITAFRRLGMNLKPGKHYPRGNDLWIKLPNGSKARFYGGVSKDYENIKGKAPTPGNIVRAVWFFEITQFENDFGMEQIETSYIRGDKGEDNIFKVFYEWNPPESRSHWVFNWREKKKQLDNVNYVYVNYNDHPEDLQKRWLGEHALNKIEGLKRIDEQMYKHIYLGEAITLGGKIYKKFRRDKHTFTITDKKLEWFKNNTTDLIKIGVDTGYRDRFVCTAELFHKKFNEMYAVETLYMDNSTKEKRNTITGNVKGVEYDPNDAVREMFEFASKVREKYHNKHVSLELESADDGFYRLAVDYQTTHKIYWVSVRKVNKGKKDAKAESAIQERINFFNILIGADAFYINEKCVELVNAFEDAVYDKNEKRRDDNTTTWNDSLDSCEYGVLEYIKNMQTRVLYNSGKRSVK